MEPLFLVVNLQAANGKGRRVFQRIKPLLQGKDEVAFTQGPGDARRIAAEAARAGHPLVVAVGGDGTVNETVNGLAEEGFRAALGIIPAGGGNDLAYALGLPQRPERALALLRHPRTRRMDLGLVSLPGSGNQRYYVNVLGMGLSGDIAALTQREKRLGGSLSYLALLLAKMFSVRPLRFELSLEEDPLFRRALVAHVANGRREGRIFPLVPWARLDDGLLDAVAVEDAPLLRRPWYALQALRGGVPRIPGARYARLAAAVIRAMDPLPCHVDGEPFLLEAGQEALVEVRPGALQVVAP